MQQWTLRLDGDSRAHERLMQSKHSTRRCASRAGARELDQANSFRTRLASSFGLYCGRVGHGRLQCDYIPISTMQVWRRHVWEKSQTGGSDDMAGRGRRHLAPRALRVQYQVGGMSVADTTLTLPTTQQPDRSSCATPSKRFTYMPIRQRHPSPARRTIEQSIAVSEQGGLRQPCLPPAFRSSNFHHRPLVMRRTLETVYVAFT